MSSGHIAFMDLTKNLFLQCTYDTSRKHIYSYRSVSVLMSTAWQGVIVPGQPPPEGMPEEDPTVPLIATLKLTRYDGEDNVGCNPLPLCISCSLNAPWCSP
jgi:hypothetical protein